MPRRCSQSKCFTGQHGQLRPMEPGGKKIGRLRGCFRTLITVNVLK